MALKVIIFFFSRYRRSIDIELTSIQRGMSVGQLFSQTIPSQMFDSLMNTPLKRKPFQENNQNH